MSKANGKGTAAATRDRAARKIAIANYRAELANAVEDAYDDGCHGVVGIAAEEKLLNSLISDYLAAMKGKKVKECIRREPTPRGVYVNSPEWNDIPR